jgi:flagellar biogenesis protein FliO
MLAQAVGSPIAPLQELEAGAGGAVVVVLLLVATLVALRLLHARRRRGRQDGELLQLTAQLSLSPTQSLYLVRAAHRSLLVGGSSSGLALLAELDAAQVDALLAADQAAEPAPLPERLRALLRSPQR